MATSTKKRLAEITIAMKKYGFDKVLSQTAINMVNPRAESNLLLDDELPKKLRLMFQELGTTFIKLGQLLSTRPDMVGEKIATELTKLQDNNPAVSYDEVKKTVEKELDGKIEDLFKDFSKQHLATASIGQVHEAHLITGEKVAVKVQKEGITDEIDLDLKIMKQIAYQADRFNSKIKKLNLPGIMEEFDRSIHKEIDYNYELMNLKRFEENFKRNSKVHVPKSYEKYSSSKVLTMEFIEGSQLSEVYANNRKFDKKLLAKTLIDSYLQQIFLDGFFHGDPHPGNIIIIEKNILCYIDLGMMGNFDEDFRRELSELMILLNNKDINGLINQLMYMDILDFNVDTKMLKRDLNDLFGKYYGAELKRFDGILDDLLTLMQEYDVVLPNEFVTMARGLSMVESIAQKLDPEVDVFASIKPIAKKLLRNKINPKTYLKDKKSSLAHYEHVFKKLPHLLSQTIHKIETGELKLRFEIDQIDYITNKVLITVLISALLISSSMVMTIDNGPMLFDMPLIAVIGYILTLILGIIAFIKYILKL